MAQAVTWVTTDRGERIPTVICSACGKRINEYAALVQRGAVGQGSALICDTLECWRQWNGR